MELCQRILDGNWMPVDWATSAAIHIFEEKGDIMSMYRCVKLLEHAVTVVE